MTANGWLLEFGVMPGVLAGVAYGVLECGVQIQTLEGAMDYALDELPDGIRSLSNPIIRVKPVSSIISHLLLEILFF